MKNRILIFLVSLALTSFSLSGRQEKQNEDRQKKLEDQRRQEELEDHYKKWLEEDAVWIIQEDERDVFLNLTTDHERDQFIEQFWLRRDPDPRTSENEYKVEHYRRIQYANEQYHAGKPGWMTDRGRVYIMFGPPDRKESYPMGGWYERKPHEGGGSTHVFPFERWEYNYIEGVGTDVELEFVDTSGSNLYMLTMNPQEKDEFLHVPGLGLTLYEAFHPAFNGQKSFDRVAGIRDAGLAKNQGIYERTKDHPFQKAELLMRIGKGPAIRYDDLKQAVEATVHFDQLPFEVMSHNIQIDEGNFMVPVTVMFDQMQVAFAPTREGQRSHIQIYGLVRTMGNRFVYEFDDDLEIVFDEDEWPEALQRPSVFQRKLALEPGRYKLDLVVKDAVSGKVGARAVALNVPKPVDDLRVSSVFLTKSIEGTSEDLSEPFILGRYRLRPNVDASFETTDYAGFYFEVYNFAVDQALQQPDLLVQYAISAAESAPEEFTRISQATFDIDRIYVVKMVGLATYTPGRYNLFCKVTDRLTGNAVVTKTPFRIEEAAGDR